MHYNGGAGGDGVEPIDREMKFLFEDWFTLVHCAFDALSGAGSDFFTYVF